MSHQRDNHTSSNEHGTDSALKVLRKPSEKIQILNLKHHIFSEQSPVTQHFYPYEQSFLAARNFLGS